jgi:hypothetical protein
MTLHLVELDPSPLELDPRPCGLCGLTIDRHVMVDDGEGPEFFCADLSPDEMTLDELERRAELRREEEIARILAEMDAAYPYEPPPAPTPRPYRTPQSTIDAFRYLVRTEDVARVKAWLAERPKDAPFLLTLLEGPTSC